MPGESSSETGNPYGRMHVTEPVRATTPVQNGARLSWDPWIHQTVYPANKPLDPLSEGGLGKVDIPDKVRLIGMRASQSNSSGV